MSSVFDGMAGALNAVFGAPVVVVDKANVATSVVAVFREGPVEVELSDGYPVLVENPTLRLPKTVLPTFAKGWLVRPASVAPREFKAIRAVPGASPAADGFILWELEEV